MLVSSPGRFSFVEDFVIDAMHTLIKGPLSKQWRLTVSDQFKHHSWNVNHYRGHSLKLRERFASFKFPVGHTNPNKYFDRPNSLKADELYHIGRLCGWFLFDGLIPRGAVRVWFLLCRLTTALLHTHVLKKWMLHPGGITTLISEYYKAYEETYGRCHMPSNFHRILHIKIDFENWGPLRSHWCFPMERLYGSLMVGFGRMNKSRVTKSIVNCVRSIYLKGDPLDTSLSARQKDVHRFVDLSDAGLCNLLTCGCDWVKSFVDVVGNRWKQGDLVCVLPAGKSVDPACIYVIAGLMQCYLPVKRSLDNREIHGNYLVLRHVNVTSSVLVRGLWGNGLTIAPDWELELGTQIIQKVDHLTLDDVHICPVAQYQFRQNSKFLIPFCGYVDFSVVESQDQHLTFSELCLC